MNENKIVYKIGMVGPSRVGKTSLITALLRDGQRLLEGSPVSMRRSERPPSAGWPSTGAIGRGPAGR